MIDSEAVEQDERRTCSDFDRVHSNALGVLTGEVGRRVEHGRTLLEFSLRPQSRCRSQRGLQR